MRMRSVHCYTVVPTVSMFHSKKPCVHENEFCSLLHCSTNALSVSLYEELSKHGSDVLGEVDNGADLTVAGVFHFSGL